jgi:hypothetical protein
VWYDLDQKAERRWLGACLACLYLLASVPAFTVHEGGHAVSHLLAGETVYCFYVTPFGGQVLALYPPFSESSGVIEELSGILATQLAFYLLVGTRLFQRRTIPFFLDSLYLMLLIVLAFDAVYLLISGPIHFGDVYWATKRLGWPTFAFVLPGAVLTWLNYRLVRKLLRVWSARHFGGTTAGNTGMVFRWFFGVLLPIVFFYWAFISPMEWPW